MFINTIFIVAIYMWIRFSEPKGYIIFNRILSIYIVIKFQAGNFKQRLRSEIITILMKNINKLINIWNRLQFIFLFA